MPERVDAARIKQERELAKKAGITPQPRKQVDGAFTRGGAALQRPSKRLLLGDIAAAVETYSPAETDLIAGMKLSAEG